tara:strand:- start:319 stop:762 length:444 start_codon:yes stop_codon:yes gene_type:complete
MKNSKIKKIIAFSLSIFILLITPQKNVNAQDNLPQCVIKTHCVRENWRVQVPVQDSFDHIILSVKKSPRTLILEEKTDYIHAEAKTKWLKYTDDLILLMKPETSSVQIRSESRIGLGDNGVNQKRLDLLAKSIKKNYPYIIINRSKD